MNIVGERFWPPTKTTMLSILWSVALGVVRSIALPFFLAMLGAKRVALFVALPGLLPIIWATRGWFAGITPVGYLVIYSINTLFYAALLLAGFRLCACLQRQYER